MYSFQGIFTNSTNPRIIELAKQQWPFCSVKQISHPFEGTAIFRKTDDHSDGQEAKDYQRLENELEEFSLQFPDLTFIHLWADCHGGICVYDGFACKKAVIFIDNRGMESDPFSRIFERNKLREIVGALGVELDELAYFEPFERGFFDDYTTHSLEREEKAKKKTWWKFWA